MCAIIGVFNNSINARVGLKTMLSRGRDGNSTAIVGKGELGHALHAVVGHVPQPLSEDKTFLVANCEIYNWEELNARFSLNAANDSELLLRLLNKIGIRKTLELIDGDFAFIYVKDDRVWIARDKIGIKPVWFTLDSGLIVASEKQAVQAYGNYKVQELHPRHVLCYDLNKKRARTFFTPLLDMNNEHNEVSVSDLNHLILESVKKRIPQVKFGLLFSGGVDSLIIAKTLQNLGAEFTCYTVGFEHSKDVLRAERIAEKYGFSHKIKTVSQFEALEALKEIVPLIQDTNVVKAGVGLVTHFAAMTAKEDGVKVLLSGLGSDELFAGYSRQTKGGDINRDCYSDLLKIFEKNTYRDDVIAMNNSIELRFPFLDKNLLQHAMSIPPEMKLNEKSNKYILRLAGKSIGLDEDSAFGRKIAAQYGSGFDRMLTKLAKRSKSAYLKQFYAKPNLKLGVLFSGGKDSTAALHRMRNQNYELTCLISLKSKNKDSFMFHTPNINMVRMQAKALELPLVTVSTKGVKEDELKDLKKAIRTAVKKYGIDGLVTGALYSNYQRSRIEQVCEELGLKVFSPLWHSDQYDYFREIVQNGFKIALSSTAALGLDNSWLGRVLTLDDIGKLKKLNEKYGLNIAGEGGEFESLTLDAPLFKKELVINTFEIVSDGEHNHHMVIKKATLKPK